MKDYSKDFTNVPFGNSQFQILNFTDGKETPARRYRHCLLQLHQKERTLKECTFRRRRIEIDIEEIKEKIDQIPIENYEQKRLEIDLEEKEYSLDAEVKLIEDCLVEVATYKAILEKLPSFSREDFEKNEYIYWEERLIGDARREITSTGTVSPGVMSSLERMGILTGRNEKGQIVFKRSDGNEILCLSKTNTDQKKIDNTKRDAKDGIQGNTA